MTNPVALHAGPVADDYANSPSAAQPLAPGVTAYARADYIGDQDFFHFAGVEGSVYEIAIAADNGKNPDSMGMRLEIDMSTRYQAHIFAWDTVGKSKVLKLRANATQEYVIFASRYALDAGDTAPLSYHLNISAQDKYGPEIRGWNLGLDGQLKLGLSEPIKPSGTVALYQGGALVGQWGMDSPQLTLTGNSIAVKLGKVLQPGDYKIVVSGVSDLNGNALYYGAGQQTLAVDGWYLADRSRIANAKGDNHWRGNAAFDTAILDGKIGDYQLTGNREYMTAKSATTTVTMENVERILFTESHDALLLAVEGNAGKAYRLYQAAFDRAPDKAGLGFWIHHQEAGMSLHTMAEGFMAAPEFTQRYGANLSNAQFVDSLYHNVLHRDGEAAGVAFHIANLEKGMARADVLTGFSESAENVAATAQLIGDGFVYTPYG
jgi:hypothetical protein